MRVLNFISSLAFVFSIQGTEVAPLISNSTFSNVTSSSSVLPASADASSTHTLAASSSSISYPEGTLTINVTISQSAIYRLNFPTASINDENGGNDFEEITLTGPTGFTTTITANSEDVAIFGYTLIKGTLTSVTAETFSISTVLNQSTTETLAVPSASGLGVVTVTGPTTFLATATAAANNSNWKLPGGWMVQRCFGAGATTRPDRSVTYAELLTVITGPEVLTTWDSTGGSTFVTYTGPTTVSVTSTTILGPGPNEDPHGDPQQLCSGMCGNCNIYFPTVDVYYWPVSSPNTACLGGSTTSTSSTDLLSNAIGARPRALTGNGSIATNADGFTFTSPSAYLAFPVISAADMCGLIGSAHTSVTLAVPPGQLSTIAGDYTYSFNFADALCPPASLQDVDHISFIGQGYRPIISPPAALWNVDPVWKNAACGAAPFQGNDPPIALTPVANLLPKTTAQDPHEAPTPASPSPTVQSLPSETFQPLQLTASPTFQPDNGDPGTSTNPVEDPNNTPGKTSQTGNDPSSQNIETLTSQTPIAVVPSAQSVPNSIPSDLDTNNAANLGSQFAASLEAQGSSTMNPNPSVSEPSNDPEPGSSDPSNAIGSNSGDSSAASASSWDPAQASQIISNSQPAPVITIGNNPVTIDPASGFSINSQNVAPGGLPATYSGVTYSLAPSASAIFINGVSSKLIFPATKAPAMITYGGQTFTADSASNILIGTTTLVPGGPAVMVSNTLLSLGASASFLMIGSSVEAMHGAGTPTPAILAWGGQSITANSASAFVLGTQTLLPGSGITVSGTPISLAASGSYAVVGTSTIPLATAAATTGRFLTFGGQTYSANLNSEFIIGSQTLMPGAAITVSGTLVSLDAAATDAVIGTSTQALGSYIMLGLGGGNAANYTGPSFTGTGDRNHVRSDCMLLMGSFAFTLLAAHWAL